MTAKLEDFPYVISYDLRLRKQFYIPAALTHTNMHYSHQFACVIFAVHVEDKGSFTFGTRQRENMDTMK